MTMMTSPSPARKTAGPMVPGVSRWCADALEQGSIDGRITGLYQHALNWQDTRQRLFCVVDSKMGNVPFGIAVHMPEGFSFLTSGLQVGDGVTCRENNLCFGDGQMVLDLSDVISEPTSCVLKPQPSEAFNSQVTLAQEILRDKLTAAGLIAYVFDDNPPNPPDPFMQAISQRLTTLRAALHSGSRAEAIQSIRDLLGLGMGLTPSGDDVLVGLMAGWSAFQHSPDAAKYRAIITDAIGTYTRGRTTDVGAAYLEHALDGRFADRLVDYVNAIIEGNNIAQATERLLSFGASSGQDCAVGVLYALQLGAEKRRRNDGFKKSC